MDKGWITGPCGVFHAKGFTILSCGKWGVVDFCAGEYLREAGCGGEGPRFQESVGAEVEMVSGSGGRKPLGARRPRRREQKTPTERGCLHARLSSAPSRPAPSDQDGPAAAACPTAPDPVSLSRCSSRLGAHSGSGFVSPSQRRICSPLYGAFLGSNTCSSRSEFSGWLN